jgi:hypothetical protein
MENKICKFFLSGNCRHGDKCKFLHLTNDNNQNNTQYGNNNKKNNNNIHNNNTNNNNIHNNNTNNNNTQEKNRNNKRKHPKNTESFKPSFKNPDMWIKFADTSKETYENPVHVNDVIIAPKLFEDPELYNKLLKELVDSGMLEKGLWKSWHGDTHFIADDDLSWKDKCPTFMYVLDKLKKYFSIDIKSTRLNWYKDTNDWKPFHHDAAAIKPHIAKIQNTTIGISFGCTRDASFENSKTRTIISIPQEHGMAYTFSKNVNIEWKHGIPKVKEEEFKDEGRISIIAWGYVPQIE